MKINLECKNPECPQFENTEKLNSSDCFCTSCGQKMIHCCKSCHKPLDDIGAVLCDECEEVRKNRTTQESIMEALAACYDKCLNGIPKVSPSVEKMANDYLKKYKDKDKACRAMLNNQIVKCTTSGFLTGFGGLITLPVTVPANVGSVLYVQMRMIACTAYINDYKLDCDQTQTFVYACLAGVSVDNIVKSFGVKFGTKMANTFIKKIPGKALTKINQKVGFRLITKFGEKGLINLGKAVPVVGAVIGGGLDLAETRIIANRAYRWFAKGDFGTGKKTDDKESEMTNKFDETDVDMDTDINIDENFDASKM